MFGLLFSPFIRNIVIVVALAAAIIGSYAIWANHLENLGAANDKAKEEVIAIQHEQAVNAEATKIDQAVSQDNTPQDTLQKQWSQP